MEGSSFLHPTSAIRSAHIHEGMHVADFGAGSGFFTRAAARAVGPSGVVWAVDAHRDMLPRIKSIGAAEGLTNIEVMHGNVEHGGGSNLPPEGFDYVIITNLLFGVGDIASVAREAKRILKRHGRALVIDWQDSFGGLGPHQEHVVTEAAARKIFEAHGFTFEHEVPVGAYHWGFVARKKVS